MKKVENNLSGSKYTKSSILFINQHNFSDDHEQFIQSFTLQN